MTPEERAQLVDAITDALEDAPAKEQPMTLMGLATVTIIVGSILVGVYLVASASVASTCIQAGGEPSGLTCSRPSPSPAKK